MDDLEGNVIDGTERARQWRRSRSKAARPTSEGADARSDAPKSIAASLLVPADMLPAAAPADEQLTGDQRSGAIAHPADPGAAIRARSHSEDAVHRNPFLAPEAEGAGRGGLTVTPASRRSIAALISRLIGAMTPRQRSGRPPTPFRATLRRVPEVRLNRPVAFALASVAAIAFTAVIVTQSETPSSPSAQASGDGAITSSLDPFKSAPLAAAAKPFPARHAARRAALTDARRVHAHRTGNKPRPRRPAISAASPASSAAAVSARYTPPESTGGSPAPASAAPSYSSSGSTSAAAPPAVSPGSRAS
jgi:hypothetical protein